MKASNVKVSLQFYDLLIQNKTNTFAKIKQDEVFVVVEIQLCDNSAMCHNNGICPEGGGKCMCTEGWTGDLCESIGLNYCYL